MAYIYFVETRAEEQRSLLCRWVECLYEVGKRIQVVADLMMAAQHLDQLLWTFSQGSFVPHRILAQGASEQIMDPVVITIGEVHLPGFDILVCDSPAHLEFMSLYPATLHFVLQDDEERRGESRLMWQIARDKGHNVQHLPYGSSVGTLDAHTPSTAPRK
ncbi:MAG: DNA polymerase III subunit chi [Syntrophobacteraceae bacterium]